MTDGSSKLCEWCERPFSTRQGGSPQRFCGASCRKVFWSALRRFGEQALANGVLTMTDIRTAVPAACTLRQGTEPALPLPEVRRSGSPPSDEPLRFFVELERDRIAWLDRLRLIKPNEAHDLAGWGHRPYIFPAALGTCSVIKAPSRYQSTAPI